MHRDGKKTDAKSAKLKTYIRDLDNPERDRQARRANNGWDQFNLKLAALRDKLQERADFVKLPDPPGCDPHDIWTRAFMFLCLALIAFCLFMMARS